MKTSTSYSVFSGTLLMVALSGLVFAPGPMNVVLAAATEPSEAETAGNPDPAPNWEALGPEAGYFVHFAFHPQIPDIVLAGSDDCGGIWKSTNGGDSWRLVTANLRNLSAWWIAYAPSEPDVVYATDFYARQPVVKSTDGGDTWRDISAGLPIHWVSTVAVAPQDANTVYVGTGSGAHAGKGVFKSTDGGATWQEAGLEGMTVDPMVMSPAGVLFAGIKTGLFRSADGAATWERVNSLPAGPATALTVVSRDVVYAAVPGPEHSLYRSADGGDSWTGLGLPDKFVWDILVEPGMGEQTIYCGAPGGNPHGVFKTTDGGTTWTPKSQGIGSKMIIGMGQSADKTLFCSTYSNEGILRSKDGGETWHRASSGLYASYITDFTMDPNNPSRVIATGLGPYNYEEYTLAPCSWEGTIAADGAMTWRLFEHVKRQLYAPAIPRGNPDLLLVGTFLRGVLFSRDGGATFRSIHDHGYCTATAFDPDDPRVAIASVHGANPDLTPAEHVMLRTEDGGETWTKTTVEFAGSHAIAEEGSMRMWVASEENGIYLSKDNGMTWRQQTSPGAALLALAQHSSKPDTLYAGGKHGRLMKTTDGGVSWKRVKHPEWPEDAEVKALAIAPNEPDKVYVGLNAAEIYLEKTCALRGGVWMTPDGGETWKDLSGDLHNDNIWAISVTPDGNHVYVATYGGGVFRLKANSR